MNGRSHTSDPAMPVVDQSTGQTTGKAFCPSVRLLVGSAAACAPAGQG